MRAVIACRGVPRAAISWQGPDARGHVAFELRARTPERRCEAVSPSEEKPVDTRKTGVGTGRKGHFPGLSSHHGSGGGFIQKRPSAAWIDAKNSTVVAITTANVTTMPATRNAPRGRMRAVATTSTPCRRKNAVW